MFCHCSYIRVTEEVAAVSKEPTKLLDSKAMSAKTTVGANSASQILILVFQSLQGNSPDYMTDIISQHLPSRSLLSVSALQLTVPRTSHCWGDRSFSRAAPGLWNNLPLEIRQSSSSTVFKPGLKTHMFSSRFCD